MAIRNRKVRRQRGSRTHGWGQIGQHRHSGSRGGTGMAGMHKHKWSYTVKYAPDHFGRNSFQPPNRILIKKWINLSEVELLAGNSKELNLTLLGYGKLLGEGQIHKPLKITVSRASSNAVDKIKAVGGSVELDSAELLVSGDKSKVKPTQPDSLGEKAKKVV